MNFTIMDVMITTYGAVSSNTLGEFAALKYIDMYWT